MFPNKFLKLNACYLKKHLFIFSLSYPKISYRKNDHLLTPGIIPNLNSSQHYGSKHYEHGYKVNVMLFKANFTFSGMFLFKKIKCQEFLTDYSSQFHTRLSDPVV